MHKYFISFSVVLFSLLIVGCSSEKPRNVTFDGENYGSNVQDYVLSKGPMDELGCTFAAIIFSTEMLTSMNEGKEIKDLSQLDDLTPVSLQIFSDRIVWVDTGITTPIEGSMVTIKNPNESSIELEIYDDETDGFNLIYSDGKLMCLIPFV